MHDSTGHAPRRQKRANPLPPHQRLAVSIDVAADLLSCSRRYVYLLIAEGRISTTKVGIRRLVPRAELERLLAAGADDRALDAGGRGHSAENDATPSTRIDGAATRPKSPRRTVARDNNITSSSVPIRSRRITAAGAVPRTS